MNLTDLISRAVTVGDEDDLFEFMSDSGFTDGLPVVPYEYPHHFHSMNSVICGLFLTAFWVYFGLNLAHIRPTPERVALMLKGTFRDPTEIIAQVSFMYRLRISIEMAAPNGF